MFILCSSVVSVVSFSYIRLSYVHGKIFKLISKDAKAMKNKDLRNAVAISKLIKGTKVVLTQQTLDLVETA